MKIRRNIKPMGGPLDVAPLVDVVFLLLIFFVLSSSFVLQPGIQVTPPRRSAETGIRDSRYIITVSQDEPPLIYFRNLRVSLDELEMHLAELAKERGEVTVVLRADSGARHGTVVQIMDKVIRAGLPLLIATQPEGRLRHTDVVPVEIPQENKE